MTTNHNSRLWLCLFLSLILHLIALFLFIQLDQPSFKKGTSTDPSKKIAGFHVIKEQGANLAKHTPQESSQSNPTPNTKNNLSPMNNTSPNVASLELYNGKGKSQSNTQKKAHIQALTKFQVDPTTKQTIEELYGEEFGDYGLSEQNFLVNNLRDIGRITKRYLQYPPSAVRLGQEGVSVVEFYLHPNGDISGLRIISSSQSMILDRNLERTIEIAYKDYPHPLSKTKIRFALTYTLYYVQR